MNKILKQFRPRDAFIALVIVFLMSSSLAFENALDDECIKQGIERSGCK